MRLDCGGGAWGWLRAGCREKERSKDRDRQSPPRNPDLAPLGHKAKVVNVGMKDQGKGILYLI